MVNPNKYKYMFRKIGSFSWYKKNKEVLVYCYVNYNYYRNPKTLNEKKQYSKLYTRAKRRNLPSSYDDISLSNKFTSWKDKTKRRKQWKIAKDNNYLLFL